MTGAPDLPIINAEMLSTWELCPRRAVWQERYINLRVSIIRALYMALDAGLTTTDDPEKAAENHFLFNLLQLTFVRRCIFRWARRRVENGRQKCFTISLRQRHKFPCDHDRR